MPLLLTVAKQSVFFVACNSSDFRLGSYVLKSAAKSLWRQDYIPKSRMFSSTKTSVYRIGHSPSISTRFFDADSYELIQLSMGSHLPRNSTPRNQGWRIDGIRALCRHPFLSRCGHIVSPRPNDTLLLTMNNACITWILVSAVAQNATGETGRAVRYGVIIVASVQEA